MFCSKCGREIPDKSNYCLYCGVQLCLNNSTNLIEREGKTLISIEYQKHDSKLPLVRLKLINVSSKIINLLHKINNSYKVKIFIDGNLIKELKNGSSTSFEVENGKHIIYCEAFAYNRSDPIEIHGNSNEICFNVTFPYIFGYERKIILTKTIETQPGTWE
jgi:hypothetical protein